MSQPKPYIPCRWQLPHLLATPLGGTVLIVERCDIQPPPLSDGFEWEIKRLGKWFEVVATRHHDEGVDHPAAKEEHLWERLGCPIGPVGTVLACKERWLPLRPEHFAVTGQPKEATVPGGRGTKPNGAAYREGSGADTERCKDEIGYGPWRSARSMPLWACRLFFRTTAIDLRKVGTMTEQEALMWGCGIKPQEKIRRRRGEWIVTPLNDAKEHYLADNPGAIWGDWAWFRTMERVERA